MRLGARHRQGSLTTSNSRQVYWISAKTHSVWEDGKSQVMGGGGDECSRESPRMASSNFPPACRIDEISVLSPDLGWPRLSLTRTQVTLCPSGAWMSWVLAALAFTVMDLSWWAMWTDPGPWDSSWKGSPLGGELRHPKTLMHKAPDMSTPNLFMTSFYYLKQRASEWLTTERIPDIFEHSLKTDRVLRAHPWEYDKPLLESETASLTHGLTLSVDQLLQKAFWLPHHQSGCVRGALSYVSKIPEYILSSHSTPFLSILSLVKTRLNYLCTENNNLYLQYVTDAY